MQQQENKKDNSGDQGSKRENIARLNDVAYNVSMIGMLCVGTGTGMLAQTEITQHLAMDVPHPEIKLLSVAFIAIGGLCAFAGAYAVRTVQRNIRSMEQGGHGDSLQPTKKSV